MNDERRAIAKRYSEGLEDVIAIQPVKVSKDHDHVYHWYLARLETSALNAESEILNRPPCGERRNPTPSEAFSFLMREEDVDTPTHNQPVYHYKPFKLRGYGDDLCPISERLWRKEIFRLPLNLDMTSSEIDYVIETVHSAIAQLC